MRSASAAEAVVGLAYIFSPQNTKFIVLMSGENGRIHMTNCYCLWGGANGRVMLIFWGERPFSPLNIVGGRFATGFGEKTEATYVAGYQLERV